MGSKKDYTYVNIETKEELIKYAKDFVDLLNSAPFEWREDFVLIMSKYGVTSDNTRNKIYHKLWEEELEKHGYTEESLKEEEDGFRRNGFYNPNDNPIRIKAKEGATYEFLKYRGFFNRMKFKCYSNLLPVHKLVEKGSNGKMNLIKNFDKIAEKICTHTMAQEKWELYDLVSRNKKEFAQFYKLVGDNYQQLYAVLEWCAEDKSDICEFDYQYLSPLGRIYF